MIRHASEKAIFYCAMTGAMIVYGMTHMRWITFNWKQIDADLQLPKKEGRFETIMRKAWPYLGGFIAGFYFGFKGNGEKSENQTSSLANANCNAYHQP